MIHPIKLNGIWTEGYALDNHVLSSTYIGEDQFGHVRFKTQRTKIGELIYKMKYNGHQDTSDDILNLASDFLDKWLRNKKINVVLPVPPTTSRDIQPVFVVAAAIAARYNLPYQERILTNTNREPSKDMKDKEKNLIGAIHISGKAKFHCNVLLIDDLYSTGSTATECVKTLKQNRLVDDVYFLAITKTKI